MIFTAIVPLLHKFLESKFGLILKIFKPKSFNVLLIAAEQEYVIKYPWGLSFWVTFARNSTDQTWGHFWGENPSK